MFYPEKDSEEFTLVFIIMIIKPVDVFYPEIQRNKQANKEMRVEYFTYNIQI